MAHEENGIPSCGVLVLDLVGVLGAAFRISVYRKGTHAVVLTKSLCVCMCNPMYRGSSAWPAGRLLLSIAEIIRSLHCKLSLVHI